MLDLVQIRNSDLVQLFEELLLFDPKYKISIKYLFLLKICLREGAKNILRGGVHNDTLFGRKSDLPPFFSSPKYTPPIFSLT